MKKSIIQLKGAFIISMIIISSLSAFSQQVIKVSIEQPGVEDCVASSTEDLKNNYSFRVFPNPANEIIRVQLDQSPLNKQYNIRLMNMVGQTLFTHKKESTEGSLQTEIDLSGIPNGIYILMVNSSEFKATEKIFIRGNK